MDRIALRFITVMSSSIFSVGLALLMAPEAMAQRYAEGNTALPMLLLDRTENLNDGGSQLDDVSETGELNHQEGLWGEELDFVGQVVPSITPVTPQDVTPQFDPPADIDAVPEPESEGENEPTAPESTDSTNAADAKDVTDAVDSTEATTDATDVTETSENDGNDGNEDIIDETIDIAPSEPDEALEEQVDSVEINERAPDGTDESGSIQEPEAEVEAIDEASESENPEGQTADAETESKPDGEPEGVETAGEDTHDAESDNAPTDDIATDDAEPDDELTAEELERRQLLIEGDRLFLEGRFAEAEELYRQAKDPFYEEGTVERLDGFSDPEQLSPAGAVYWREYQAGLEADLDTRTRVPLTLLRETQPEFVPGHLAYAQLLVSESEIDEALEVLEQATALYPDNQDLAMMRVETLVADKQWLQAAIASRQFALLEPDHPEADTFQEQADDYQGRFRRKMRRRLTRTAIGNAIAGAAGFALTGSWFGPLSAIETTILMIQGESAVGARIANNAHDELDMIEDEVVLDYVNDIGQELAELGGRTEFEYEFYVVAEDELNAFALPGGKIFINAGAITRTDTGAELAGLIAHELAHAILSHGFQQVTRGNLTANVLQTVPYGGLVTNLTVLRYSRDMERQADRLGTRLLATSPYAADGVRNLMQTLAEESENQSRFDWLSTHPDTPERVRNLERLIEQNGYNRYAFEGIERHLQIQERVKEILIEMEKIDLDLDTDDDEAIDADDDNSQL